ncbi:hypothetical protein MRX96_028555 [Rhipicephalus microplus]
MKSKRRALDHFSSAGGVARRRKSGEPPPASTEKQGRSFGFGFASLTAPRALAPPTPPSPPPFVFASLIARRTGPSLRKKAWLCVRRGTVRRQIGVREEGIAPAVLLLGPIASSPVRFLRLPSSSPPRLPLAFVFWITPPPRPPVREENEFEKGHLLQEHARVRPRIVCASGAIFLPPLKY